MSSEIEVIEKAAAELANHEDPVVREAGLKILAVLAYLRHYYESAS